MQIERIDIRKDDDLRIVVKKGENIILLKLSKDNTFEISAYENVERLFDNALTYNSENNQISNFIIEEEDFE